MGKDGGGKGRGPLSTPVEVPGVQLFIRGCVYARPARSVDTPNTSYRREIVDGESQNFRSFISLVSHDILPR